MYDPLVVDTFIRVHDQIAPAPSEPPEKTPLRAITAAAIEAGSPSTSTGLEEIAASSEEMLTLFDLARGLSSPMSVSDAGDVIAKHLRRLIPSALCVFYLYDVETDELIAAHATGENAGLVTGLRVGVGQRLSGWVAAHRQTIRNSDPILDFGDAVRTLPSRLRSCLATPMTAEQSLVGVLSLYALTRDAFSEEHQRVIEVISKQVSAIMKGAASFERSVSKSMRDAQTGLPNRERLTQLTQPADGVEVLSYPVSALVIRIDHQKLASGDLIVSVAAAARKTLRSADLLFRSGDRELVALLLKADKQSSSVIANRLQDALSNISSPNESDSKIGVRVVASSLHHDASSIDRFLRESEIDSTTATLALSVTPPGVSQSVH
jgi:diguanylate cyclase (GGDEF)-like protein